MTNVAMRFLKWVGEKWNNLFKEKPPSQQPFQILIEAGELTLTAKNLRIALVSGNPNGLPSAVIQASPQKPEQISDKKD